MNILIRRFLAFVLSFVVIVAPAFAVYDPNAKHSKWFNDKIRAETIVKNSVEVKAQRTYPVAVVDPKTREILMKTKNQASSIKVVPAVNSVGKTLMKRVPAAVMTQAIIALLGKSVDWVMDEENNGVKYKESASNGSDVKDGYIQIFGGDGVYYRTREAAANAACVSGGYKKIVLNNTNRWLVYCNSGSTPEVVYRSNPDYRDPEDWKRIPINSVAQKVLDQSNADDAAAKQVIADAVLDMFEAGELDSQLETAAEPQQFGPNEYHPQDPALKEFINGSDGQPGSDGQDGSDGQSPNPSELPAFCSWASIVCDWIGWTHEAHEQTNQAIETNTEEQRQTNQRIDDLTVTDEDGQKRLAVDFPKFCSWATPVCDLVDWVMSKPDEEDEDTELDIDDQQLPAPDTTIDFGGQCPAPFAVHATIFGSPIDITLLDTNMFCDFLSTYVKWPVYAASSLFALYIVGGRRDE